MALRSSIHSPCGVSCGTTAFSDVTEGKEKKKPASRMKSRDRFVARPVARSRSKAGIRSSSPGEPTRVKAELAGEHNHTTVQLAGELTGTMLAGELTDVMVELAGELTRVMVQLSGMWLLCGIRSFVHFRSFFQILPPTPADFFAKRDLLRGRPFFWNSFTVERIQSAVELHGSQAVSRPLDVPYDIEPVIDVLPAQRQRTRSRKGKGVASENVLGNPQGKGVEPARFPLQVTFFPTSLPSLDEQSRRKVVAEGSSLINEFVQGMSVGVKNERSEVNERANPAEKPLAGELNHHAGQLAGELNHHVGQLAGELNRRVVILARRAQPSRRSARRRAEPPCGCTHPAR
ncbi:hypothetical protein HID58_048179 [Brassica napus]|uniref:Uncharacterized protein n=1 Tax=Brassica napus TaxID=3708 RepID=A0ABQ8B2W1_BRANA|nr:hypothetical protein HID58_048179 [Brassica napus]